MRAAKVRKATSQLLQALATRYPLCALCADIKPFVVKNLIKCPKVSPWIFVNLFHEKAKIVFRYICFWWDL
jgi:hypothetical protein